MHALLLVAFLAPRLVADVPAAQAVPAADGLVILEPDLLHLAGLDANGKRRWRRRHQAEARGIQALFTHEGRVLFYAGDHASLIDARTGAPGPAVEVPWLSSPGQPGCWLNTLRGAYAFYCPCRFQFARFDGAALGEPYRFHEVCMHEPGGGGSCGCWGSGGDLIGRAGDQYLARIEEPPADVERGKKRETYGELLVSVSSKTGKEVWRQPVSIHRPASYIDGLGVMPDAQTFWTADAFGRISAHDTATGALRWRDPPTDDGGDRPHQPTSRAAAVGPDGLFFSANG
ncbi:MAG: PQQ-binding-like beta-propeller repeat protein, partial [Myxococcales bacterium]|nr:PQQ-binding-like beta-propeller repeat protein [Myxococcales bacterium]